MISLIHIIAIAMETGNVTSIDEAIRVFLILLLD